MLLTSRLSTFSACSSDRSDCIAARSPNGGSERAEALPSTSSRLSLHRGRPQEVVKTLASNMQNNAQSNVQAQAVWRSPPRQPTRGAAWCIRSASCDSRTGASRWSPLFWWSSGGWCSPGRRHPAGYPAWTICLVQLSQLQMIDRGAHHRDQIRLTAPYKYWKAPSPSWK